MNKLGVPKRMIRTADAKAWLANLPHQSAQEAFGGLYRSEQRPIEDDWMADIRKTGKSLRGRLEHSMILATVSADGRITLPKDVRDAMDLVPGDKLRFVQARHGFRMTVVPQDDVAPALPVQIT